MKSVRLSVVIPAYNEETNIRLGAIDKVVRYLETREYPWEVVIVDDGSSDGTLKLLQEACVNNRHISIIQNPHQGKAATVITGVKKAKGEIILFTDLDQATPISEIEGFFPYFSKGYDVVIGSRKDRREGAPFLRRVMAKGFIILRTLILGLSGISDTQCGFKAFTGKAAKDIFGRLRIYTPGKTVKGSMVTAGFDIELLYIAKELGYSIREVPVEWHYVETRRVNPVKDSWMGFVDILRIRKNANRGIYE